MRTEAGFVDGAAGKLFRVSSWPVSASRTTWDGGRCVLLVPPFVEEMNRSRRFLAALRRAIAARGACATLLDPYGTGDSEGDLAEATWTLWRDDLVAAVERLRADGAGHVAVLGVRAGSLLVDDVSRRLSLPVDRLLHVQPETHGEAVIHRLLRARVAKGRLSGTARESVEELWSRLESGESLELGGYRIGAALANALRATAMALDEPPRAGESSHRVQLTERARTERLGPEAGAARATPAVRPGWKDHSLASRPFWQLQDSLPDPELVAFVADRVALPMKSHAP